MIRRWLAENAAHQSAYDAARRAWHGVSPLGVASANTLRGRRLLTRRSVGAALAASVAAVAVFIGLDRSAADMRTGMGEVREIVLPDGGTAWLDTDSAIALAYDGDARNVTVIKGQAWFDVADEARPFVVRTHDTTITDIGTVFGVRRDGEATEVFVSEGEVRVECRASLVAVRPGAMAACTRDGLTDARPADVEAARVWQSGRLVFVDRPLGEVLKEIDRYAPGMTIGMLSGSKKARRVTAHLELDQLASGLDALAASENLRISRLGPVVLIGEKS